MGRSRGRSPAGFSAAKLGAAFNDFHFRLGGLGTRFGFKRAPRLSSVEEKGGRSGHMGLRLRAADPKDAGYGIVVSWPFVEFVESCFVGSKEI